MKFEFDIGDWVTDITKDFNQADKDTIPIMKAALYEGAKVMADRAKSAAN